MRWLYRNIFFMGLGASLLAACGGSTGPAQEQPTTDQQAPARTDPPVIKPLVKITNPELAALAAKFPLATLPLATQNDSVPPAASPLFANSREAERWLPPQSPAKMMLDLKPWHRLPDYGNFVALVYAALQQESGGLQLVLVTYAPDGKPVDELFLKDDADSGTAAFFTNTTLYANMRLEQTRTDITYTEGSDGQFRQDQAKPTTINYQIEADGKIVKQ
ncbi:MAG: hypothetical protein MUC97_12195 [Bernardetiaceae bacterium]|jgi:hypothetical protein|nr:hypothetical protein [Bernardetiaceae bacterium]